jgi:hypothetical protein
MQQQQPQPQIAVDPNLAIEQQQAQQENVNQLQIQSQQDTAAMMARYGTRMALSGASAAPSAYNASLAK